jgi:hypothetical protein
VSGFKRKVIGKHQRRDDLEVRVSQVTVEGEKYVEIREYVTSLDAYGRGILIPASLLIPITNDLEQIDV